MNTLITIIHVITCVLLILVVLLQSGKGGGLSSTFGGASAQIFGGRGAGDFMTRVTSGAAMVFFVTSFTLATISSRQRSAVERALESNKPAATDTTSDGKPTTDAGKDDAVKANEGEAPKAEPTSATGTATPTTDSKTDAPADKGPAAPPSNPDAPR
ncbi:MAG: preprotein translocase subunit SecG [Myxococcota bacterium]|nr:preprotein translocase subunit SecG [Myxococcota bacterium]